MNQSNVSVVLNRTVILTVTILSFALVASVGFAAWGFVESKKPTDLASATFSGKAERQIESDTAKWTVTLKRNASSTEEAVQLFEADRKKFEQAVAKAGVSDAIYSYQPLRTQGPYREGYDGEYYYEPAYASQAVTIESKLPGALGQFNQSAAADLRSIGLIVSGERIEFSYSKVTDLEQELTKIAAENARKQAESMLGNQLGKLRSLDRPQLTVRSANSADSYYAQNDITSFKKQVMVTVVASYRIK